MKVWKLVAGILSIVLVPVVVYQSRVARVVNILSGNGEFSGSAGLFVAILLLAGGIVSIATRKVDGIGGNIALISIFGIAFLIGVANAGIFADLLVWSWWCMINLLIAVIDLVYNVAFEKAYINNVVQAKLQEPELPGGKVANWYYHFNNRWYGPITRKDVPKLSAKGHLTTASYVYYEGSQQAVLFGDSPLRGYMPVAMLPESKSPRIVVPTVLIPVAIFAFGIVFTVAARSGSGNKSSEAAASSETSSSVVAEVSAQDSVDAGATSSDQASTENDIQKTLDTLEVVGSVEVEQGEDTVTMTVPAEFAGDATQDALDQGINEGKYISGVINSDGSVTLELTKEKHQELLGEIESSIDKSLNEMIGSDTYPNFTAIDHNQDYTLFTVSTRSAQLSVTEKYSVMALYTYGGLYNIYAGTPVDKVQVDFVNSDTGELLDSASSDKMRR